MFGALDARCTGANKEISKQSSLCVGRLLGFVLNTQCTRASRIHSIWEDESHRKGSHCDACLNNQHGRCTRGTIVHYNLMLEVLRAL